MNWKVLARRSMVGSTTVLDRSADTDTGRSELPLRRQEKGTALLDTMLVRMVLVIGSYLLAEIREGSDAFDDEVNLA
jgi:hypothetical protein